MILRQCNSIKKSITDKIDIFVNNSWFIFLIQFYYLPSKFIFAIGHDMELYKWAYARRKINVPFADIDLWKITSNMLRFIHPCHNYGKHVFAPIWASLWVKKQLNGHFMAFIYFLLSTIAWWWSFRQENKHTWGCE